MSLHPILRSPPSSTLLHLVLFPAPHPPPTNIHPRRLLDRRIPQPRPLLRSRRRDPHLPPHPMGVLGRTHLRRSLRSAAPQTYQIARIRECESGSGGCAFGWEDGGEWEWEWESAVAGVVGGGRVCCSVGMENDNPNFVIDASNICMFSF